MLQFVWLVFSWTLFLEMPSDLEIDSFVSIIVIWQGMKRKFTAAYKLHLTLTGSISYHEIY